MQHDETIQLPAGVFPVFFTQLARDMGASEAAARRSLRKLCRHGVFTRVSKGLPGFPPLYRVNWEYADRSPGQLLVGAM